MQNNILRTSNCLLLVATLSGCNSPVGLDGLEEYSLKEKMTVNKPAIQLAACVAEQFDREPSGFGEVALPANGYRQLPNGQVQVFNSGFNYGPSMVAGLYGYFLDFKPNGPDETLVDIKASTNVNPYLSKGYVLSWIHKHLEYCSNQLV